MKTARFLTISIVGFILLLSLAIPALAAPNTPPIPSSFYGEIHFQSDDGGPSAGNFVDAYVLGVTGYAARATITDGGGGNLRYAINVPGDDDSTPGIEGGLQDGTVTFKFGERVVATGIWRGGTNENLVIHPPKANAGGPYAGVVGDTLTFSGSATDWLTTETYTYAWDLDDDGAYDDSTVQNPSFSFATTGAKTIKLQVTDSRGGIGTKSATVVVVTLGGLTGQTYDGNTHEVTIGGLEGGVTVTSITYGVSTTAPTNAGTYPVVVTFSNGATITNKSMTIAPKPITVTANGGQTKVYGDADPALTYTVPEGSLVGTDAFDGALARAAGVNVGDYAINQGTLTAGTNYAITFVPANLTITPKSIAVTAEAKAKVYGDADPALTYTFTPALVGSDAFSGALFDA